MATKRSKKSSADYALEPSVLLREELDSIASRIRNIGQLASRLDAEGGPLSPEQLLARLKKRKAALIKDLKRYDTQDSLKKFAAGQTPAMNLPLIPDQKFERATFFDGRLLIPDGLGDIADRYALITPNQAPTECISFQDDYDRDFSGRASLSGFNSINHGSTPTFAIDETHLNTFGVTFIRASLDDDAAWWRDDNPDRFAAGYEMLWELPRAPCDMWVIYRVDVRQRIEFNNSADDGGRCRAQILHAHTNANGAFGNVTITNSSGIQTMNSTSSRNVNRGPFIIADTFPIDAGRIPKISLLHLFRLSAQDGKVSVLATLRANRRGTSSGPPELWAYMIPRGGGCFISTAICEVLGKPDDCRELQLLRSFRDDRLARSPGGAELIAHYYQIAPAVVAEIHRRPDGRQVLAALYELYLREAIACLEAGRHDQALSIYRRMVGFAVSHILGSGAGCGALGQSAGLWPQEEHGHSLP